MVIVFFTLHVLNIFHIRMLERKTSWKDLLTAGSLSFRVLVATDGKTQPWVKLRLACLGGKDGQWVLPQLTRLHQRVSEGCKHATNAKCWVFDNCHLKVVLFIVLRSDTGPRQCFGPVYLLPRLRHKDRSRHCTASPQSDTQTTTSLPMLFHFRDISMGRHLLTGKENLAFELNSTHFLPILVLNEHAICWNHDTLRLPPLGEELQTTQNNDISSQEGHNITRLVPWTKWVTDGTLMKWTT